MILMLLLGLCLGVKGGGKVVSLAVRCKNQFYIITAVCDGVYGVR